MVKLIFTAFSVIFLAILAGCSSPASPANNNQPVAGVYYSASLTNYQMPQVFIWNGSSWKVGSESRDIISVERCASFEGDSVANLVIKYSGNNIDVKAVRLPISPDNYGQADSAHPFSGIYGTHDNSYIFSIKDDGVSGIGHVTIIYPPTMAILAEDMSTNFQNISQPQLLLTGHDWGYITYNPIAPQPLTGLLQWIRTTSSIQLIGMDGCGR